MGEVARLREAQGRWSDAVDLSRQAVTLAEEVKLSDDWQMARYRLDYGRHLTQLRDFPEAEKQLLASFALSKTILGLDHQLSKNAVHQLVELYGAWDKPLQAAEYRRLLSTNPASR